MKKIQKATYSKLENIVKEMSWHLSSAAVVSGNNPGNVYVDNAEDPKAAFLVSPEGCYLVGEPNNDEFNTSLKNFLQKGFLKQFSDFELIFQPKWKDIANQVFTKTKLSTYLRFHYIITKDQYLKAAKVWKRQNQVEEVNSLYVRNHLGKKNMQHVNNWILNNWGSYENYDEKGFGYYILEDDKVISWSICDCIAGDKCEIGIWADQEHRLKGKATSVIRGMLHYAFSNGFKEVGWHCSWDNIGSYKTAEKSGFIREREYLSYYPCDQEK